MAEISSSDYIAGFAVFVSLLALAASSLQLWITYKHNRLSVKPHIDLRVDKSEEGIYSIEIVNNGLGAAILSSIKAIDGNRTANFKDSDGASYLFEENYGGGRMSSLQIEEGCAILVGEPLRIIEFTKVLNPSFDDHFDKKSSANFIIEFKSMYGEVFTTECRI